MSLFRPQNILAWWKDYFYYSEKVQTKNMLLLTLEAIFHLPPAAVYSLDKKIAFQLLVAFLKKELVSVELL